MTQLTTQNSLISIVQGMKGQIAAALPKHVNADRIVRIAMTTLRQNKKLANCNKESFLGSLIVASQLGLEPNTPLGQCYLIPYGNECQFQIGYKGLIDLAYRSKQYKRIFAEQVYPNDIFKPTFGLNPNIEHERVFPEKGEPIAYYAVYETVDGGTHFVVWGRERVIDHAKKYSKSYNGRSSPWQTSFDAMAKKTVIIDLLKYAPKSIELAEATSKDAAFLKIDENSLEKGEIDIEASFEDASIVENAENHTELMDI